jgi:hypothetical protein
MIGLETLDENATEAAFAETRRRWGPSGGVSIADRYKFSRCLVGELRGGRFWIRGRGSSWAAAFADADARGIDGSRRKAVH